MTNSTLSSLDDLKDLPPEALFQRWAHIANSAIDAAKRENVRDTDARELLPLVEGKIIDKYPTLICSLYIMNNRWVGPLLHIDNSVLLFGDYEDVVRILSPTAFREMNEDKRRGPMIAHDEYHVDKGVYHCPEHANGDVITVAKLWWDFQVEALAQSSYCRNPELWAEDPAYYRKRKILEDLLHTTEYGSLGPGNDFMGQFPIITLTRFRNPHHAAEGLVRYVTASHSGSR